MKRFLVVTIIIIFSVVLGWFAKDYFLDKNTKVGKKTKKTLPKPLDKYTIQNLSTALITQEKIEMGETLKEDSDFTSYLFSFSLDPTLKNAVKKKVTGLINVPKGQRPFPLIVIFRGYVDQKIYQTGTGTQRGGEDF